MNTKNNKDIRWKQRFQNLERAIKNLNEAVAIERPSDVEQACASSKLGPSIN